MLENDKLIVKVLTLGAILNSFYVKKIDTDIVLGFDDYSKYLEKGNASMGKSIGRCANRIGNAKFTLNDKVYTLLANNGPNTLHGGLVRFGDKEWSVGEKSDTKVVLLYDSPHMESGFPGNLKVKACYEINDNELTISYSGVSDEDTIFNMTNHAYFNLDQSKTNILNHELKIGAECVNLNDENGMAMEETVDVDGTPFDFREFKKIGESISANGVLLNQYCKGIIDGIVKTDGSDKRLIDNLDTNYIYESLDDKLICELKNDKLKLSVSSNLPCVQIYTGKSLDVDGRDGHYSAYAGIAIEPQFCPNAINYKNFLKPILKAGVLQSYHIKYSII